MRKPRRTQLAALAFMSLIGLTACGYESAQPGTVGVVKDDYVMIPTDPKLIDCIPSQTTKNEFSNDVYYYPSRQISWDATGDHGSERKPYVVVSSKEAPAELNVPVTVTFDMTSNCDLLKKFHAQLGTKYSAWMVDDGNNGLKTSQGWTDLLDFVVGQPTNNTLIRLSQTYTWQQIWNDDSVRTTFQQTLQKELPDAVKSRCDGETYFTNFQVVVGKPDPVDPKLKDAIAQQQTSVAQANAAKQAADAQVATAEAQTKVAQQEALQKQAEIAGYPSVEAYLQALAIEKGMNPFQPNYGNAVVQAK